MYCATSAESPVSERVVNDGIALEGYGLQFKKKGVMKICHCYITEGFFFLEIWGKRVVDAG
jgi:hypothetical protein